MKIAILGTGNLGHSIAKGILQSKGATTLYLTRRNTALLRDFEKYEAVTITSNNREAAKQSNILIFAVQSENFAAVLEEIKDTLTKKHVIISTVAGFSISAIEYHIGADKPIIRSMPNTAIAVGQSMTCLCGNTLGNQQIALAETIFNAVGHTLQIPEKQMQAATVLCASGVAFWMRMIRATIQGAIQLGFEAKEAQELALHTCHGAARLLIASGNHPEVEIDRVTTPNGCTIAGLNEMEHQGLSSSLIRGMVASFDKINQIRKE